MIPAYNITLIKIDLDTKTKIIHGYYKNTAWKRIKNILKSNKELPKKDVVKLPFVLEDLSLIYHVNFTGKRRLCVPNSIMLNIFVINHGQLHHGF